MRDEGRSTRSSLWPMFFLLLCLLLALAPLGAAEPAPPPEPQAAGLLAWDFQGRVFEGDVGDETKPLKDVTVTLYGSNDQNGPWTQLAQTKTDANGWYGLSTERIWELYRIVESDPTGYYSVGATSVGGTAINNNTIEYAWPLAGKTLTGNKFWDKYRYTATPTQTQPRPTSTPTVTPRITPTPTQTPKVTPTFTVTPRFTPTPTATWRFTPTPTATSRFTPTPTPTGEALHDLGDAPSHGDAFAGPMTAYPKGGPLGIGARFHTIFDPPSGHLGPIHWQPRAGAWLGQGVSLERNADLLPDEDGLTNLDRPNDSPDRDGRDDGLHTLHMPAGHCQTGRFEFSVTCNPAAVHKTTYYLNAWYDFDRNGKWGDQLDCGTALADEWVVHNQPVPYIPGTTVYTSLPFLVFNLAGDHPIWVRLTLTHVPIGEEFREGSGPPNGWELGETEDYYLLGEVGPTPTPTEKPGEGLADLGDAPTRPDVTGAGGMTAYPAGMPPGVPAQYHVIYAPPQGHLGPIHWQPRQGAWLGQRVSLEENAHAGADEDGLNNIDRAANAPDRDKHDDGLILRPEMLRHCQESKFKFLVTYNPAGPQRNYFLNAWFDWNRNGQWGDEMSCNGAVADEWVVKNQAVPYMAGGTHLYESLPFIAFRPDTQQPIWIRLSLTAERLLQEPVGDRPGHRDGRGLPEGYEFGETEDYYYPDNYTPPEVVTPTPTATTKPGEPTITPTPKPPVTGTVTPGYPYPSPSVDLGRKVYLPLILKNGVMGGGALSGGRR